MTARHRYWFPAKRYGWGWGPPTCWQGWLVVLLYALLVLAGCIAWPPPRDSVHFLLWMAFVTALLIAVCWRTGEPPRWRWGE